MRIIANLKNDSEVFELVFSEKPSVETDTRLTRGFESEGYKIDKRRPDGKTIIWTLTHTKIVCSETLAMARHLAGSDEAVQV